MSLGGNYYSVPDGTAERVVEVEATADQVRIHVHGKLLAVHPLLAAGDNAPCCPATAIYSARPNAQKSRLHVCRPGRS